MCYQHLTKIFGYILMSLVVATHSLQEYNWSCSPLNDATNEFFLPDVHGEIVGGGRDLRRDEVIAARSSIFATSATDFFLYPLPPELNCNGTVIALEFCYIILGGLQDEVVLRFYMLEQTGNNTFIVTGTIDIYTIPTPEICTEGIEVRDGRSFCCDRWTLDPQDYFHLPSDRFAFGLDVIFNNLLIFEDLSVEQFYTASVPQIVNNTFQLNQNMTKRTLRLFNLVLSTDPPTLSSTSTTACVNRNCSTEVTTGTPSGTSDDLTVALSAGIAGGVGTAILIFAAVLSAIFVVYMCSRRRKSASQDLSVTQNEAYGLNQPHNGHQGDNHEGTLTSQNTYYYIDPLQIPSSNQVSDSRMDRKINTQTNDTIYSVVDDNDAIYEDIDARQDDLEIEPNSAYNVFCDKEQVVHYTPQQDNGASGEDPPYVQMCS